MTTRPVAMAPDGWQKYQLPPSFTHPIAIWPDSVR